MGGPIIVSISGPGGPVLAPKSGPPGPLLAPDQNFRDRTLYFEANCPLTRGKSTSKGVTLLRSKVSGADSLLRSKVFGGQFASK